MVFRLEKAVKLMLWPCSQQRYNKLSTSALETSTCILVILHNLRNLNVTSLFGKVLSSVSVKLLLKLRSSSWSCAELSRTTRHVVSVSCRRTLRSAATNHLVVPSFKVSTVDSRAAANNWNTLLFGSTSSVDSFRRELNTFLFQRSFCWLLLALWSTLPQIWLLIPLSHLCGSNAVLCGSANIFVVGRLRLSCGRSQKVYVLVAVNTFLHGGSSRHICGFLRFSVVVEPIYREHQPWMNRIDRTQNVNLPRPYAAFRRQKKYPQNRREPRLEPRKWESEVVLCCHRKSLCDWLIDRAKCNSRAVWLHSSSARRREDREYRKWSDFSTEPWCVTCSTCRPSVSSSFRVRAPSEPVFRSVQKVPWFTSGR